MAVLFIVAIGILLGSWGYMVYQSTQLSGQSLRLKMVARSTSPALEFRADAAKILDPTGEQAESLHEDVKPADNLIENFSKLESGPVDSTAI